MFKIILTIRTKGIVQCKLKPSSGQMQRIDIGVTFTSVINICRRYIRRNTQNRHIIVVVDQTRIEFHHVVIWPLAFSSLCTIA
jgi:hypothetical protein